MQPAIDQNVLDRLDVEQAFDSFVTSVGGTVLRTAITKSPTFENADYVFHDHKVVAELKCLRENKLDDATYMKKIETLWQNWCRLGLVTCDIPDQIPLAILPPQCARELIHTSTIPLKGVIRKANRQIRQTKQALNIPSYRGLLLLANDGNYALPPQTLNQLVGRLLKSAYSSIDAFVLFSVNMFANIPGTDVPCMIWLPSFRSPTKTVSSNTMTLLRDGWAAYHEKLTGQKCRRFGDVLNDNCSSPSISR